MMNQNDYSNRFDSTLNILSFTLGLMNLRENLTQNDKQEMIDSLDKKTRELLSEIHSHLQRQDEKLDKILELLYNK